MGETPMHCKVCSAGTVERFAGARILHKYDVDYFRCARCGFVCTEEPFWLDEAYAAAITGSDVGLVRRNLRQAPIVMAVISTLFRSGGRFVDYGGGYGMLVRLLRDVGFDFYRYDRHCANLFAREFEAEPVEGGYELLTAMELFEHLADPIGEIGRMLGYSRSIFFTTELLPTPAPRPGEWWYYGLDHGQHISFYTRESLAAIAARFGLTLITDGVSRHLLTERRVSPLLFRVVSKYKAAAFLAPLFRRESLIPADYQKSTGKSLSEGNP